VQDDEHLPWVMRYVQRNPVRANMVRRAEEWRWGSLYHQVNRTGMAGLISEPPVEMPAMAEWLKRVNRPETAAELLAVRRSVARQTPFGRPEWTQTTVRRFGLEHTERAAHRPKRVEGESK
jgi:putative transposase